MDGVLRIRFGLVRFVPRCPLALSRDAVGSSFLKRQGLGSRRQGVGSGSQGLGSGSQGLGSSVEGLGSRRQGLGSGSQGLLNVFGGGRDVGRRGLQGR
jgi:hypothetical protein